MYILACHLQFFADPDPAYHFDADQDPTFQFDADPYPQHWQKQEHRSNPLSYMPSICQKEQNQGKLAPLYL
jgi:hypothetical protein